MVGEYRPRNDTSLGYLRIGNHSNQHSERIEIREWNGLMCLIYVVVSLLIVGVCSSVFPSSLPVWLPVPSGAAIYNKRQYTKPLTLNDKF